MTTSRSARAFFDERFRSIGTPERAAHDRAYLKSDQRFYGATVPQIRRAGADFSRQHRELTRTQLRAIVTDLYASGWYEHRSVAIALLGRGAPAGDRSAVARGARAPIQHVGARRLACHGHHRRRHRPCANGATAPAAMGGRQELLGPTGRPPRAAASPIAWGRRLRALRAARCGHGRGEGVLHPQGHRLDPP